MLFVYKYSYTLLKKKSSIVIKICTNIKLEKLLQFGLLYILSLFQECIGLTDDKVVRAIFPASSSKYKASSRLSQDMVEDFTFTTAFGPESGQFAFFANCMMDTMQNFIEGQNSLVFSYGTTGSGKTFTLQGS